MSKELTIKDFKALSKLSVMALRVTELKANVFKDNPMLYDLFIMGVNISKDFIRGEQNILKDIENEKFKDKCFKWPNPAEIPMIMIPKIYFGLN